MENVIFCAMFAYKIYDKKLVQIQQNSSETKFIHSFSYSSNAIFWYLFK